MTPAGVVEQIRGAGAGIAGAAAERAVLRALERAPCGSLEIELPSGARTRVAGGLPGPAAALSIRSPAAFLRVATAGEIGVGESYVEGEWSSPDLPALLEWGARNRAALALDRAWLSAPARLLARRRHLGRRNSTAQARRNIAEHYDIGNDFFRLFLDPSMTYSSAVFASEDQSLEEAQANKYRLICEKAGLGAGERVLEIGSGWGGFAVYAARHYDCHVTTITISKEQLVGAQERAKRAGCADQIDVRFLDYRDMPRAFGADRFDRIVSIEMFEAVGDEFFGTFFEHSQAVVRPGGRMVLQTIAVPERTFQALRAGSNWIQRYIFPGGMLPSLAAVDRALGGSDWILSQAEDIGPHYARTLACWRRNFLAQREAARALGLDERFLRMWEYYLAISEAGFRTRQTADYQLVLERPG